MVGDGGAAGKGGAGLVVFAGCGTSHFKVDSSVFLGFSF